MDGRKKLIKTTIKQFLSQGESASQIVPELSNLAPKGWGAGLQYLVVGSRGLEV
jgi:hypothetical protein